MKAKLYIALGLLMACSDCEATFEAGHRACPHCASLHFFPLAKWLDRQPMEEIAL